VLHAKRNETLRRLIFIRRNIMDHTKPDPIKCGAGRGEECCIFLTAGSKGFECERFGSLRDMLISRTMNAKRNPEEPYPQCMKF